MQGQLIDCYILKDSVVLWVKAGGKNYRFTDTFTPKLFIAGSYLKLLRERLYKAGIHSTYERKKTFLNNEIIVLAVPTTISTFRSARNKIERICNYNWNLFTADLKMEEYYLFEKNLFPTALIEYSVEGDAITSIAAKDNAEDLIYTLPQFTIGRLKVRASDNLYKITIPHLNEIIFNHESLTGDEKSILLRFKQLYSEYDPDVLWTEHGNRIIPFLARKFEHYGISFQFSRFDHDDFPTTAKGDVYTSYGRVFYRNTSVFFKGRLHFDTRAFFADDTGYYGILDAARVCRQRIQRTEMRSAGAAVTNYLLYTAHKRGFLLPYKTGLYERFKTLHDLYRADRGSVIFEPRVGFHTDIAELDFVSLYPSIMHKYNLSPETLYCKCCPDNQVPGLPYHYCTKQEGVVGIVAKQLIERRIAFKKQGTAEGKQKADYLKWLLVTMFGYQAFKGRKIGIIETHESIQAYAREILLRCTRIAESQGFEVIHGIIDSLYVKKPGLQQSDVDRLRHEIETATGLRINHEGTYRWMVFLPSILDKNIPVSSHFYGVFLNGEIKCRGIEARRRNIPQIVASMQTEMIERLSEARSEEEFRSLFSAIFSILHRYVRSLPYATRDDLKIITTISKTEYANTIAQGIVLGHMKEKQYEINPGQTIAYIILDAKNKNPKKRYIPTDQFDGKFDISQYTKLLLRSTFSFLQPFGVTLKDLEEAMKDTKQLKITNYILELPCVEDSP